MRKVYVSFLSILFALSAHADFSQTQTRYLGFYDVIKKFKAFNGWDNNCKDETREYSLVFGYSMPINGKTLSDNPNFDFLNTYLSCLKNALGEHEVMDQLSPELKEAIGSGYHEVSEEKIPLLKQAIDEMTMKYIGPEVVLVSYGHIDSQNKFRELIHESVMKSLEQEDTKHITKYLLEAFTFINLRDEALSY